MAARYCNELNINIHSSWDCPHVNKCCLEKGSSTWRETKALYWMCLPNNFLLYRICALHKGESSTDRVFPMLFCKYWLFSVPSMQDFYPSVFWQPDYSKELRPANEHRLAEYPHPCAGDVKNVFQNIKYEFLTGLEKQKEGVCLQQVSLS